MGGKPQIFDVGPPTQSRPFMKTSRRSASATRESTVVFGGSCVGTSTRSSSATLELLDASRRAPVPVEFPQPDRRLSFPHGQSPRSAVQKCVGGGVGVLFDSGQPASS